MENELGLVHLYWGDGKGKTTAAMGLALRALGHGLQVSVVQFLKDGTSGEIALLRKLGATVWAEKCWTGFLSHEDEDTRSAACIQQTQLFRDALAQPCDLLILDEACGAWEMGTVDRALLQQAVTNRPAGREVVLTGRHPAPWMREVSDYSTQMVPHAHPYQQGVNARKGIEF